jgi:hypothetical protein
MNQVVCFGELSIRAKNSECYGKIETCTLLAHISRSKVDRCLLKRKEVTAVLNGSPDAFTRLAYGSIRETNDRYRWSLIVFTANWS